MSRTWAPHDDNPRGRVHPAPPSGKRHRDGLDALREAADSALAVLLGFGGVGLLLLLMGRVLT